MHRKELPGIKAIFRKDKDKNNYENNALLFQDILQYKLGDGNGNNCFKVWDLTKWLLDNNQEFYNDYHATFAPHNTTISNRVEARSDRVKARIEDLITLGLVQRNGTTKATKGNGPVPLYQYTELGHFIALIIHSMRPPNYIKDSPHVEMYDLFDNKLQESSLSSVEAFCSFFFKNCQEKGLFSYVETHCKSVLESDVKIKSTQAFFEHSIFIPFKTPNAATRAHIWNLWKESFNELDSNVKKLFLYRIKMYLESRIEENIKGFREYEKVRFRFGHNPKLIVIEGQCNKCNFYSIQEFDIVRYMDRINSSNCEPLTDRCPKCRGQEATIEFPTII